MTRIDFYFNLEDKYRQLALLSAQALRRHRRLYVLAPDDTVTRHVETALWSRHPTGFLPHCRAKAPLAEETPILIGAWDQAPPHDDVLVNLCPQQPDFFSRFLNVIELVGQDEQDRAAARVRFRFYRDRGYEIGSHDRAGGDS